MLFRNNIVFISLKIVFVLASSIDPYEMPRYARGISSGSSLFAKVSKGAKIRNRYNQAPHPTQDTNGKVTNSQ